MNTISYFIPQSKAVTAVRALHRFSGGVQGIVSRWESQINHAVCLRNGLGKGEHAAPDPNCGCGFGLCDDIEELDSCEYLVERDGPVLCLVEAWGNMVIDGPEEGATFRAEDCRVVAIADARAMIARGDVEEDLMALEEVAKWLGVELVTEEELEGRLEKAGRNLAWERARNIRGQVL